MPDPLPGLVVVAEAGSKFECDILVNRLLAGGVDAIPSYDPAANSVAPHWATDRTFEVLVREEDVVAALDVLSSGEVELPVSDPGQPWHRRRSVPARTNDADGDDAHGDDAYDDDAYDDDGYDGLEELDGYDDDWMGRGSDGRTPRQRRVRRVAMVLLFSLVGVELLVAFVAVAFGD